MKKFSAHFLFDGKDSLLKYPVLTVDNDGTILEITDTGGNLKESAGIEFMGGILIPGFVNVHCHLELSALKGTIDTKQGLPYFISQVVKTRTLDNEAILKAITVAHNQMLANGIVAVGDISNTNNTAEIKMKDDIFYYTFVEVFSRNNTTSADIINKGAELLKIFNPSAISPHATYSLTEELFLALQACYEQSDHTISIHNQETKSENIFYSEQGDLYEFFDKNKMIHADYRAKENAGLQHIYEYLPQDKRILLVHNTYTGASDIEFLQTRFSDLYWGLCPKSNLYIEDRLPDISLLHKSPFPICIGTDSLASNTTLSVLEEIKCISATYPEISIKELLRWATYNGAACLGIDRKYGSIEVGKKPGVLLLENTDLQTLTIKQDSFVRRLI